MEYSQETAFKILTAMENYPDSVVPSPYMPLEEDTGHPVPRPPIERAGGIFAKPLPTPQGTNTRRATPPKTTHPKSWIGEMETKTFLEHVNWLRQEKLITTGEEDTDLPKGITMTGVELLKEVEVKGGWEKAVQIASEAKAAATLSGMRKALRKAKTN